MINMDTLKLSDAIESVFPNSHIVIIDKSNTILNENNPDNLHFKEEFVYNARKEIKTLETENSSLYYKLSFPIQHMFQLFVVLQAISGVDILMMAKMIDSIIQLSDSKPTHNFQISRQSNMTLLLDHLLHPDSTEDYTYAALLAAELGLNMSLPRAVCILHLNFPADQSPQPHIEYSVVQSIRQFSLSSTPQDILGTFAPGDIILCHVMSSKETALQFLENLHAYIESKYRVSCMIAVGLIVNKASDYVSSLASARSVFQYVANNYQYSKPIFYVTDFFVEHFVFQIPEKTFEHFYAKDLTYLRANPTAVETIKALVENNMYIIPAAESLFIHRNTMIFRLNQLKKQLNINPLHVDSDRFKLILLYHYYSKIHAQSFSEPQT